MTNRGVKIIFDKNNSVYISKKTIDDLVNVLKVFKKWRYGDDTISPKAPLETKETEVEKDIDNINLMEELNVAQNDTEQKYEDIVYKFRKMSYYNFDSFSKYDKANKDAIIQIAENKNTLELFNKYFDEYMIHKGEPYFVMCIKPKTFIEKIEKVENYFTRKEESAIKKKQGTSIDFDEYRTIKPTYTKNEQDFIDSLE